MTTDPPTGATLSRKGIDQARYDLQKGVGGDGWHGMEERAMPGPDAS